MNCTFCCTSDQHTEIVKCSYLDSLYQTHSQRRVPSPPLFMSVCVLAVPNVSCCSYVEWDYVNLSWWRYSQQGLHTIVKSGQWERNRKHQDEWNWRQRGRPRKTNEWWGWKVNDCLRIEEYFCRCIVDKEAMMDPIIEGFLLTTFPTCLSCLFWHFILYWKYSHEN